MKFDVVTANPPYQHPEFDNTPLWSTLTELSLNIIKEGGYACFLTPRQIIGSTKAGIKAEKSTKRIQDQFTKHHLIQVDYTADRYFSVGQSICSWVWHKEPGKETKIILDDGSERHIEYETNMRVDGTITDDIIDKIIDSKIPKYKRERGLLEKQKDFEDKQSEDYRYPVIWGTKDFDYKYSRIIHDPSLKLCINNYKSFIFDNLIITDQDVGQNYFYIRGDRERLEKIREQWTTLKLLRYFGNNFKFSNGAFLIGQRQRVIPILDPYKNWTDKEIYELFNLDDIHVKEVEDWVKKQDRKRI